MSITVGIQSEHAPRPVGHYPHARRVGQLLFISGIGPRDPASNAVMGSIHDAEGNLVCYDIEAQCNAVFANVRAVLHSCGADWADVVDVTAYLTDMERDFPTYNAVWGAHFPDPTAAPCRTSVGITSLPTQIAIELKCIAVLKD